MSLILNIDTSVTDAFVCLANEETVLEVASNSSQKDHAAWLHIAIAEVLENCNCSLNELDAIAVSAGPGSYTGLRVSMSTAKGLCYASKKPLIVVSTLKTMALAAITQLTMQSRNSTTFFCPMIDARRMEVFTAVFDMDFNEILPVHNKILDTGSFMDLLHTHEMIFLGNGSEKFKNIITHSNAVFKNIQATAKHLAILSHQQYVQQQFADLAYVEPFYVKEFYSPQITVHIKKIDV